mgnify:CR=1 FL=1
MRNYVTVGLEALSPVATQRLMRELLPGANVPQTLRQGILAKAEGNPFFIEEIVRMFVDLGILTRADVLRATKRHLKGQFVRERALQRLRLQWPRRIS